MPSDTLCNQATTRLPDRILNSPNLPSTMPPSFAVLVVSSSGLLGEEIIVDHVGSEGSNSPSESREEVPICVDESKMSSRRKEEQTVSGLLF